MLLAKNVHKQACTNSKRTQKHNASGSIYWTGKGIPTSRLSTGARTRRARVARTRGAHARTQARTHTHTHTHTFNSPFSGTTQVSRYQKGKPIWILLQQETVSGSGLSWAICKSAPSSRHTTMPAPHNSVTFQSIKFQSYQTLQPHMTAYSSARMYSLICVIISNKWDLHSLSYLQGHSRLCVM